MEYNNNFNYSEIDEENYQSSIMNQEPNNNFNFDNNFNKESEFLEISLVPEIIHSLTQIEKKIPSLSLDEVINERIHQLAYCEILVNIYNKDISYLIKSQMNLGIAYYDKKCFSQALEHLLLASKYNEENNNNKSNEDDYNKENKLDLMKTQIKIFIYLAKCYLETDRVDAASQIADKCLEMNKKLFKDEFHISNADIYYLKVQCDRKRKLYDKCNDDFKHMVEIYEKNYGIDCDKVAKICHELGDLYVMKEKKNKEMFEEEINKAIEKLKFSYSIWEKVLEKQENEENSFVDAENNDKKYDYSVLFEICIKISNLYFELNQINDANEILNDVVKYEDKLNNNNEQTKINFVNQKIKIINYYNKILVENLNKNFDENLNKSLKENLIKNLEENLKLAKIYEDSINNEINEEIDFYKHYDLILEKEIKIKKKKKNLAKIYIKIGYIYNEDQIYNYNKCLEYFNKAKKIYSNIKDKENVEKMEEKIKNVKDQVKKFNNDNKDLIFNNNSNNNFDNNNNDNIIYDDNNNNNNSYEDINNNNE